ncbi:hypothetical protein PENSPDRAFT_312382 [Peniophora sp. CONT]|nr:hypothetical protein PENSPDRAFT_312382 [Peniophora sp. CONT]
MIYSKNAMRVSGALKTIDIRVEIKAACVQGGRERRKCHRLPETRCVNRRFGADHDGWVVYREWLHRPPSKSLIMTSPGLVRMYALGAGKSCSKRATAQLTPKFPDVIPARPAPPDVFTPPSAHRSSSSLHRPARLCMHSQSRQNIQSGTALTRTSSVGLDPGGRRASMDFLY